MSKYLWCFDMITSLVAKFHSLKSSTNGSLRIFKLSFWASELLSFWASELLSFWAYGFSWVPSFHILGEKRREYLIIRDPISLSWGRIHEISFWSPYNFSQIILWEKSHEVDDRKTLMLMVNVTSTAIMPALKEYFQTVSRPRRKIIQNYEIDFPIIVVVLSNFKNGQAMAFGDLLLHIRCNSIKRCHQMHRQQLFHEHYNEVIWKRLIHRNDSRMTTLGLD
jgi:hypothetical protein